MTDVAFRGMPSPSSRVSAACAIAAFGAFLFGYDSGAFSGAQIFVRQHFQIVPLVFGMVTSALLLGCVITTIGGARIQERLGARTCLAVAAALFIVGSLGASLAWSAAVLVAFRLVSGVATGIISVASPMYINEIAPPALRGRLGLLYQLALTIGQLLGLAVGWLAATTLSPVFGWRWLVASTAVPSLLLLLWWSWIPESPRWLLAHGREAEALAFMRMIRTPDAIEDELAGMRAANEPQRGSYCDLLRPGLRWALLTGVLLGVFNNWTGGTGIGLYLPTLFQAGGYPIAGDALAVVLLVSCVNVGFTGVSVWLVDRVGRRPLWMSTTVGMILSITLLGWAYHINLTGPTIIGLTLMAVMCHALGLGPLPWLMISELFPGPARVAAVSVCTSVLWLSGFTCVLLFPLLAAWSAQQIGSIAGVFWVFAGMSLLALIFGRRLLPETKGKTIEEVARHWPA